jgi:hypothetical protein
MNKKTNSILTLVSLSFLIFLNSDLISMEVQEEVAIKTLPPELNAYMTQFLGNKVIETLKNLARLSMADRYFHQLVANNLQQISDLIKKRFGAETIKEDFKQLLNDKSLRLAKAFLDYNIIDKDEAKQLIIDGYLKNFGSTEAPRDFNLAKQYLELKLVSPDDLLPTRQEGIYKSPIYDLLQIKKVSSVDLKKLLAHLQQLGWDINKPLREEMETPLYLAVANNNQALFELLLQLGADPSLAVNKEAIAWAEERDNGIKSRSKEFSFMQFLPKTKSYRQLLEEHGFKP